MSIEAIREIWSGRTASKSLEKFKREYARKFRVVCTTANDDVNAILSNVLLPVVGVSLYPTDSGALCDKSDLSQDQNKYDISYHYSSDIPVVAQQNPDPLARPAVFKTTWTKQTKPIYKDLDGIAVLNSAGQPFEQPIEIDSGYPILTIEKNYASYSWTTVMNLQNTINDDVWQGFPKWAARMDGIDIEEKEENGAMYFHVVFRIIINNTADGTWHPFKILDAGYGELDDDDNLVQILDKYGQPVSKPVPLDGAGHSDPTSEVYQQFRVYQQADWSGIP